MTAPFAPNVPAEFTGLARQFIRDLDRESALVREQSSALMRPVFDRLHRCPGRQLRDGAFSALADAWAEMPHAFRLGLWRDTDKRGRRGMLTEVRVHGCGMEDLERWPGSVEPGITITAYRFEVPQRRTQPLQYIALVGLHALARRYERGGDRSHRAVMGDLAKLVRRDMNDLEKFPEQAPFRIDAGKGAWVGLTAGVDAPDVPDTVQFVVRSFLRADQTA